MTVATLVTVLIPAWNEEPDIVRCLDAVLVQDHPHDRMEIVLVDGGSTDRTASLAKDRLAGADVSWTVVVNPVGTTPSNLNAGLSVASGDIVCRVDARSFIPENYVRTCATTLTTRPDVAVVGGAQVARGGGSSSIERGIARALNNRLVMGGARYRSQAPSGPDDTVYLGAFRTHQLRALGGWNEALLTNQDFDLNRRMAGFGLVWFDDSIPVEYRPRSDLRGLARQYHRFGRAKFEYWRNQGDAPLAWQWALIGVPTVVAVGAATALIRSTELWSTVGSVAVAAGLGALAVDSFGPRDGAGATVRGAGILAAVAVAGGWLSGVACGFVIASRPRKK